MASEKRQQDTSLKDRLFEEFYRFSFFRAVALLESMTPGKKPIGRALSPSDEAVSFSVKPDFVFPPSDISDLRRAEETAAAEMEVTFMGLVGPAGVLPGWYSKLVQERMQEKDFAMKSFFDIFHHRLISLFYLAWKKYRFTVNYQPEARDGFSRHLMSIMGLGTENLAGRIGLSKESLIFNSGLLSRQVPSAVAIESAVTYFSGVGAEVDQFVDRLILLDPDDYSILGIANAELGVNTVCGTEAWECQTKFRVKLGPMDYEDYIRFLPTGGRLRPVFSLIKYMVGIEYEFEVRLVLKREEVFQCRLGEMETPGAPRLGWSTWLKAPGETYPVNPCITFQQPAA